MNLKQIEVFVKIAETKSFSKTAKDLYLTQPTVSTHMAALENSLGTKLIARTTKEVNLTDNGNLFYEYAKKMMILSGEMETLFVKKNDSVKEISIAASSIPANYILPKLLPCIKEKYPDIKYRIEEGNSEMVAQKVSNREVEVGFIGTKYEYPGCSYAQICEDDVVIITPNTEKYKELQKSKDLKWLYQEAVILRPSGSGTRKEAERLLNRRTIHMDKLNVIAEIENSETIKRSVRHGMGVSIMSKAAVADELEHGQLLCVQISKAENNRKLYVVHNKYAEISEPAQFLIKKAKTLFEEEN